MTYRCILYDVENQVAAITLNLPQVLNAISAGMRDELRAALARASADSSVKVVVIRAAGKAFSSGTDLQEAAGNADVFKLLDEEYRSVLEQIQRCPKPVIGAVQGACVGIGTSLALSCDLVAMGESAYFALAFANLGLIPDGGLCWHLVRHIGCKRAYQVIAEAGRIAARDALALGLVNKVVDDEQLHAEVQAWAGRLAQAAPLALRFAKVALQEAGRMDLGQTIRLEASLQSTCAHSEDAREAVRAFLEKRKPAFQGR